MCRGTSGETPTTCVTDRISWSGLAGHGEDLAGLAALLPDGAGQRYRCVFAEVAFEPVMTREVRLEAKLRPGFSGGVLEWTVKEAK